MNKLINAYKTIFFILKDITKKALNIAVHKQHPFNGTAITHNALQLEQRWMDKHFSRQLKRHILS